MRRRRTSTPKAIEMTRPRIQLSVLSRSESFTCRRCLDSGYLRSEESFDSPLHIHPEIELLYIETSSGTRYVADSVEPYGPGDLVLIGANIPHVFRRDAASGPASSIVVQFRRDFLGDAFFSKPEMSGVQRLIENARHGLHFGAGIARWAGPRLKAMLSVHGAPRVLALLDLLARLVEAPSRPLATSAFRQEVRAEDLERLARVFAFVQERFDQDLGLEVVAREAALSPTSFSRWFSNATGKPFIQFLTELRMEHAYRELTETGKTVTEIAFDCGFNSVSHFIHRFQAMRGVSPREFRLRFQSGTLAG